MVDSISSEYRGFRVVQSDLNLKTIWPLKKGSVPNQLLGKYVSYADAVKAIDSYLAIKGCRDGKAK